MQTLADLGQRLAELRRRAGMQQQDLARAVGMRQEALSRFERGRGADFSLGKLLRLCDALGHELRIEPLHARRPTLDDVLDQQRRSANTGPGAR